jgi:hypothetical protein
MKMILQGVTTFETLRHPANFICVPQQSSTEQAILVPVPPNERPYDLGVASNWNSFITNPLVSRSLPRYVERDMYDLTVFLRILGTGPIFGRSSIRRWSRECDRHFNQTLRNLESFALSTIRYIMSHFSAQHQFNLERYLGISKSVSAHVKYPSVQRQPTLVSASNSRPVSGCFA